MSENFAIIKNTFTKTVFPLRRKRLRNILDNEVVYNYFQMKLFSIRTLYFFLEYWTSLLFTTVPFLHFFLQNSTCNVIMTRSPIRYQNRTKYHTILFSRSIFGGFWQFTAFIELYMSCKMDIVKKQYPVCNNYCLMKKNLSHHKK